MHAQQLGNVSVQLDSFSNNNFLVGSYTRNLLLTLDCTESPKSGILRSDLF